MDEVEVAEGTVRHHVDAVRKCTLERISPELIDSTSLEMDVFPTLEPSTESSSFVSSSPHQLNHRLICQIILRAHHHLSLRTCTRHSPV